MEWCSAERIHNDVMSIVPMSDRNQLVPERGYVVVLYYIPNGCLKEHWCIADAIRTCIGFSKFLLNNEYIIIIKSLGKYCIFRLEW